MMIKRFVAISAACGLVLLTGGVVHAENGLTCTATGKGTNWHLGVTGASVPVGGYVAGFPGGTVTTFSIDGYPGQPDTTGLPPGTSNGLFTQIPSGKPVVLDVTTSSPPTGPFTVAYINQAQTGYGPPFACPFGTGASDKALTVAVADVNGDGMPDLIVSAPGSGTVVVEQTRPKKARVKPERVSVTQAADVTVPLHANATGKSLLAKNGKFTARVKVTYTASDGTTASKTVSVTFSKS